MVNNAQNVWDSVTLTLIEALNASILFLPQLLGGLIILLVGWVVASILKTITKKILKTVNINNWLEKAGVDKRSQQNTWISIASQIVFWTIIIMFLIPVFETWRLPGITPILNEFLRYIPQVVMAIVAGFIGIIIANIVSTIVRKTASSYGKQAASILSSVARYAIFTFTAIIVLNQLGVAERIVEIFFIGIMFAVSLALGLSFGLGGKDTAAQLLSQIFKASKKQK